MKTISLSGYFDGESIRLDEPYNLPPNTKVIITVIPEETSERESWLNWSIQALNNAYGEEDEYPLDPNSRGERPFAPTGIWVI
ncbi:MAG: hypothetical protein J7641_01745 [Cyanobacteria bacterium SID2]|nr:hypothetical protein [Cyanobacteria bacterium SID2]MBP0003071.1 hypothetical protein [Cyanobacteria bacterium SBC]